MIAYKSLSNPSFLSLVNRTINLVIFFQILQGFTLVPWQKVGKISWICQYLKNRARMLESSLYKSSRVVPRVTLAPFLESQVQNLKNRVFLRRLRCFLEKSWSRAQNFFFFFIFHPILAPGVPNESSFKSRLTNPKSQTPQASSKGRKSGLNPKNTAYSVTYSYKLEMD